LLLSASMNLGRVLRAHNATKALVAGPGIHLLRNSRRGPIAKAVVRSTQEGTSFHHLSWNLNFRALGIVAFLAAAGRPPGATGGRRATSHEPVAGPFPHIAGHVIQAITVRREPPDR